MASWGNLECGGTKKLISGNENRFILGIYMYHGVPVESVEVSKALGMFSTYVQCILITWNLRCLVRHCINWHLNTASGLILERLQGLLYPRCLYLLSSKSVQISSGDELHFSYKAPGLIIQIYPDYRKFTGI